MLLLIMLKDVLPKFTSWYVSKNDGISIMKNSNLVNKKGVL